MSNEIIQKVDIQALRTAVTELAAAMISVDNCGAADKTTLCQTSACQYKTCQECQGCQGCQSNTCQSQTCQSQSCQSQCKNCNCCQSNMSH